MLDSIKYRRSIRKYKDQEVTMEQVDTLVRAGMCAPSAHNRQPWEIVVLNDKEVINTIGEKHKYAKMLFQCNKAIVVLGNKEVCNNETYIFYDTSAVIQNILTQAVSMGLGTCWCALAPDEERAQIAIDALSLPSHIIPVAVIALGYPDEEKGFYDKYSAEKVHLNKYGNKIK